MVKTQADTPTEERILAAARKVFIAHGLTGARMQEIADEAGINKALLHYYFRSKEKLFETILTETMQSFLPRINAIFTSELPVEEKIAAFCSEYIDKMLDNPFIPLFVVNEINNQPDDFFKKIWGGKKPDVGILVKQLEAAAKEKMIRPVSPVQLILNIMSMCVFPFVAKPMFQKVMGISDKQFRLLMEERKKEIPAFIMAALRR
ncbi:MAG TPA: TetR/AcrR family transcriptional regulator [Chitinophagaceae bacterium]|jgi:AcrR family transcriptional regulator|nr:TetR/AcrR family transcriptional regulator [Chitinophagaceae bacterium]HMU57365.1 TetR/AcrR family transcriptional regulator [Chitinophagaceae bacterium]